MNDKLALSMVVKDETEILDRCLSTIAPYVGGLFVLVTGDNPETTKILKKYNANIRYDKSPYHTFTKDKINKLKKLLGWKPSVKPKDVVFLFDEARNIALKMVPDTYKYIMWVDADDIVKGGENLTSVIKHMEDTQATAMFMEYLYDVEFDDKNKVKNILIQHKRERIVINNGTYKWIAPIHETLIPQTGEARQLETKDVEIIHTSKHKDKEAAIHRNIKVLEWSIIDTDGKDPRPLYYLAKAYFDLHSEENHKRAEKLIYQYLKLSGWAEERAQAWEYLSEIYRGQKQHNMATKAALNALVECPKFPSTYLSLGLSSLLRGQAEDALFWVQLAAHVPSPQTTLVVQPRDLQARALEIIFNASVKQNKLDEAWASIYKLSELFPIDENIKKQLQNMTDLKEQRELTKNYIQLVKALERNGEKDKMIKIADIAPEQIENNPFIAEYIKKVKPPKTWDKKTVALYCGPGWTVWNPDLYKQKTGAFIGGSEEAVILAAKALTDQGYKVIVYADPGIEGVYDGVHYLHHFKFNPKDEFDILIVWRMIHFFDQKIKARKTYLWLHDTPVQMDFKKERLDNITKIMVLSKAQRELLPQVPEEKFLYTSNGFAEEDSEYKPEKVLHSCLWTSSYDRGLQHLLEMWGDIRKEVPDATLRIFYGWQLFERFYANNPERMKWKAKIDKLMEQDGVFHGSRVPQDEIEKEYKKAQVWAYPTDFYEINCISAIKAQAFGAIPVVIDYAALKETVQYGRKVKGDIWDDETRKKYVKEIVAELKSGISDTKAMQEWAHKKYNWKEVTNSWIKDYGTI